MLLNLLTKTERILQKIYYELRLHKICKGISNSYKFSFNLSPKFLEKPDFDIQHIYRSLEVFSKETDFIQAELYKNSLKPSKRNTGILYYDCTNYFFEIEQEQGLKQYGYSKEHRLNPIVQMWFFMDGDGIPLAFSITKGNTNEQLTLKPLEQTILDDFKLSKFVVCTDAGLASNNNRKFNAQGERAFITTQFVKKLKKHLKEWMLFKEGWRLSCNSKVYDISNLEEDSFTDKTFYKERWIKENGLEQKLIVTYSVKYRDYQRKIRNSQIDRAVKVIETNPSIMKKSNQNDYKRFIDKTSLTPNGEIAEKHLYSIDLEDEASEIIKINHKRWEIEECFRIMKSEFKARPVYLTRDDRIEAHFTTCFLAMVLYRF